MNPLILGGFLAGYAIVPFQSVVVTFGHVVLIILLFFPSVLFVLYHYHVTVSNELFPWKVVSRKKEVFEQDLQIAKKVETVKILQQKHSMDILSLIYTLQFSHNTLKPTTSSKTVQSNQHYRLAFGFLIYF